MTLTKDDLQAIKKLLDDQEKITARKIETEVTNLERTVEQKVKLAGAQTQAGLKRQIRASEDNLSKRFDKIDDTLTKIGQDLVKFIGEVHQDQLNVNKNHEKHLKHLETNVFAS